MEDRDGQHMGVVTKALVKLVPPSSMILRVLFITCREPRGQSMGVSSECYSFTKNLILLQALLILWKLGRPIHTMTIFFFFQQIKQYLLDFHVEKHSSVHLTFSNLILWVANNYNSAVNKPDGHSALAYGLYLIFHVVRKTTEILMQIPTKTKKLIKILCE